MAGLNLPSESGEYDSPVQGVKVQKLMAVVGPASVCPCNGCGVSPNIKRTQCGYQGWRQSFLHPYVEALWACCTGVEAGNEGGSKPL